MLPALVIGLGGTGSWVAAHLKRLLVNDARYAELGRSPDALARPEYNRHTWPVDLKALDVDKKLRPVVGDTTLATAVEDISLAAPIGQMIEDIQQSERPEDAYPTVQQWLPQKEAASFTLLEATKFMAEGAGQIRQFGRLAFFYEALTNGRELSKLDLALNRLLKGDARDVAIFVVGSVAGGTGAGLLIDTLVYLQDMRRRTAGNVALRTNAFVVLPGAFAARGEEFERMQANGAAALRELDRLVNAHDTVAIEWRPGQRAHLSTPAVDVCYLVDGSRDTGEGPQLEGFEPYDQGVPVAIAEAIYTHVLPGSGRVLGRDYPNLTDELIGTTQNRYSSFGSYAIRYDWERLIRSFALRSLGEALTQVLSAAVTPGRGQVGPFLTSGAAGNLSTEGVQQAVPPLASEALAGDLDPLTFSVPGTSWLEPREDAAPTPATPLLADQFPGIGRFRTEYTNEQVRQDAERIVERFFGGRTAVWDGRGDPTFYAAVNYNAERAEREWRRALLIAATAIMNMSERVGGFAAALDFLESLELTLGRLSDVLAAIPQPDLGGARARLQEAEEEMNDGRTWDDYKEQRDYIQARQELLGLEVAEIAHRRTTQLVGRFLHVTGEIKDHVAGWQSNVKLLLRQAEETRIKLDDERQTANRAPQERFLPLPGDQVEGELYAEAFGRAEGTTLPRGLLQALEQLSWRLDERPDHPAEILLRHPARSESERREAVTLNALLSLTLGTFVALRDKSVFEVMERAGESAERLADEIQTNGARLAAYDVQGQLRGEGTADVRDWDKVFAAWVAEGSGSGFSAELRDHLARRDYKLEELSGEQPGSIPTGDKVLVFSARHLLALQAFAGVQILDGAYRSRRNHVPSPHVLPEERGAALMEERSEVLARNGNVSRQLDRMSAREVAICADQQLLQYLVASAAADAVHYETTDAINDVVQWTVEVGDAQVPLGDDPDLGVAIRSILGADTHAARSARSALQQAGAEFTREGEGRLTESLDQVLRVAAAELADKL